MLNRLPLLLRRRKVCTRMKALMIGFIKLSGIGFHSARPIMYHRMPALLLEQKISTNYCFGGGCDPIRREFEGAHRGNGLLRSENMPPQEGNGLLRSENMPPQEGDDLLRSENMPAQEGNGLLRSENMPAQEGNGLLRSENMSAQEGNGLLRSENMPAQEGQRPPALGKYATAAGQRPPALPKCATAAGRRPPALRKHASAGHEQRQKQSAAQRQQHRQRVPDHEVHRQRRRRGQNAKSAVKVWRAASFKRLHSKLCLRMRSREDLIDSLGRTAVKNARQRGTLGRCSVVRVGIGLVGDVGLRAWRLQAQFGNELRSFSSR